MFEQVKLYDVLKRPVLSEKSSVLRSTQNKVLVEVAAWANKNQIARAAKVLFDVDVLSVNTLNYRGKVKRVRQHMGKQKNTKRAFLTLSKLSDVDLFGVVGQEVAQETTK